MRLPQSYIMWLSCCRNLYTQASKFFVVVQKLYNVFTSSLMWWKILQSHRGCSLHSSHKRWSDRVESVKPFASHIPGIRSFFNALLQFNLTPETTADVQSILKYTTSFLCILLSAIWLKVLLAID